MVRYKFKYKLLDAIFINAGPSTASQAFLHFLPDQPQRAKLAPVNKMNNTFLLKSPAEARQPARVRNQVLAL